jgi:hypothetical protein
MLAKLRSYRPSHSTVVAYIALFIALGGTSYGLASGSIGSREIKNNSVRSKDIRNNTIRGKDIRTGTILSSDVGDGSLLAQDFAAGQLPAGAPGPKGDKGDTGAPGQDATNLFAYVREGNPGPATATAVVQYGSGVTGVDDPSGNNSYTVTFNRSLTDCVVQAVSGLGDPAGNAFDDTIAIPSGFPVEDTSFLITAFC